MCYNQAVMKSKSAVSTFTPVYQEKVAVLLKENPITLSLGLFAVFFIFVGIFMLTNTRKSSVAEAERKARAASIQSLTVTPSVYTVQEGEGLWQVAEKTTGNGENWVTIAQINNIINPDSIVAGQKLVIPAMTAPTGAPSPTLAPATIMPSPSVIPTVFVENGQIDGGMTKRANPSVKVYIVKEGEGLWQIAEKVYGDGEMWTAIMKENNLQNPDQIVVGMKLKMPHIK